LSTRIGVDIGGTFCDVVYYDSVANRIEVAKGASTPDAPHQGVVRIVASEIPRKLLSHSGYFVHGSTVGLNALLERKGAKSAVITTKGFRDLLEIRRGERRHTNDIFSKPVPPLVPRRFRYEIKERILADGTMECPVDMSEIGEIAERLTENGIESVAVTLINAYLHPQHEVEIERGLRTHGFQGTISLSHRVSGEIREYERASTTAIDAFIRPKVSQYLRLLDHELQTLGHRGRCLVVSSGGGAIDFDEASDKPSITIQSGPVGGATAAGKLCQTMGLARAVAFDIGGTSTDCCLIVDGQPGRRFEAAVAELPIQGAWVDIRSVGAGGGSIAYLDKGGVLCVGPESAGARPGPACYGHGGTEPTLTDAACLLGMLGPGLLGGGIRLNPDVARQAFAGLAAKLGLAVEDAAIATIRVISANMANAIREVTTETGEDPRAATLIAFGGAGPLLATHMMRELEMPRAVVPRYAGNFSAWGLLVQDLERNRSQSLITSLDEPGLAKASALLARLFGSIAESQGAGSSADASIEYLPSLDMRYAGQSYSLNVAVAWAGGRIGEPVQAIAERFNAQYKQVYGHALDARVEIVTVRAMIRTKVGLPDVDQQDLPVERLKGHPARLAAYSFTSGKTLDFLIIQRAELPRDGLAGPAIILEETATTYLDQGFRLKTHATGALVIERFTS
jgi:N-methylhydantoinase A